MKTDELLRPLTYADLVAYDEPLSRYEIFFGELIASPTPTPDHGQLVRALYDAFKTVVKAGNPGRPWAAPVDVELGVHNIYSTRLALHLTQSARHRGLECGSGRGGRCVFAL